MFGVELRSRLVDAELHLDVDNNGDEEVAEANSALLAMEKLIDGFTDHSTAVAFLACETRVQQSMIRFERRARFVYEEHRSSLRDAISSASSLAEEAWATLLKMRRSERIVAQRKEVRAKALKCAMQQEERCRQALICAEEQRRALFERIQQPQWEVPHHFHMTAVEHFRGNQQRQIGEIATMFPGHLRLLAAARRTAALPASLFPSFKAAQTQRKLTEQALSVAAADLQFRQESVDRLDRRLKELQSRLGREARRDLRKRQGNLRLYRSIKQRYFAALNLASDNSGDDDVQDDSATEPDDELLEPMESWDTRIDDVMELLELRRVGCKQAWDALQAALMTEARLLADVNRLEACLNPNVVEALHQLREAAKTDGENLRNDGSRLSRSRSRSPSTSEDSQVRPSPRFRVNSVSASPSVSSSSFFHSSPVSPSIMALG